MKFSYRFIIQFGLTTCLCVAGFFRNIDGFAAESVPDPNLSTASESSPRPLSPNVTEVIRLAETGVEEEVTLAYIENSQSPFALSAEDTRTMSSAPFSPAESARSARVESARLRSANWT